MRTMMPTSRVLTDSGQATRCILKTACCFSPITPLQLSPTVRLPMRSNFRRRIPIIMKSSTSSNASRPEHRSFAVYPKRQWKLSASALRKWNLQIRAVKKSGFERKHQKNTQGRSIRPPLLRCYYLLWVIGCRLAPYSYSQGVKRHYKCSWALKL